MGVGRRYLYPRADRAEKLNGWTASLTHVHRRSGCAPCVRKPCVETVSGATPRAFFAGRAWSKGRFWDTSIGRAQRSPDGLSYIFAQVLIPQRCDPE
jgi:hypothetical protein